jgi:Hermes transposase DNA-binding domain
LRKKNQLADLIKNNDKSIKFYKPKKSHKSSAVWEFFSVIVVNNVKQEMVCCDKCKLLLTYRCKDGTNSLAKHQRLCQRSETNSNIDSINQTKLIEYYSSSKTYNVPKKTKEKVKMACTQFVALDSRAFELVSGDGFLQMAQSIFDAGKHFNPSSNVNVKELIPSPITVNMQLLLTSINIIYLYNLY